MTERMEIIVLRIPVPGSDKMTVHKFTSWDDLADYLRDKDGKFQRCYSIELWNVLK